MNSTTNYDLPHWIRIQHDSSKGEVYLSQDLSERTRLYRYMTLETALKTLDPRKFRLAHPGTWDDPYERELVSCLFRPGSKLSDVKAYGMCWTTNHADEPFWRIYMCPNSATVPAVRIRTTVGRLRTLALQHAENNNGKAFLGRVKYLKREVMLRTADGLTRGSEAELARMAAKGLHLKRQQFRMENEVRLLWIRRAPKGSREPLPDFEYLGFDLGHAVDQVMIGPTKHVEGAKRVKDLLVGVGVPKELIEQSQHYTPPDKSWREVLGLHKQ